MPTNLPWVVAGTGTTLRLLDRNHFRILALNRAIHFFPVVDAWAFAHQMTFESCADQVHKTPIVLTGDRMATDPGEIRTDSYLPLYNACAEKLRILKWVPKELPGKSHFLNNTREHIWGCSTIACLAACWVARFGQEVLYTVGVDGGREIHPSLTHLHRNRYAVHGNPIYNEANYSVGALCKTLGMKWVKLNEKEIEALCQSKP